jgi:hypothetical protein
VEFCEAVKRDSLATISVGWRFVFCLRVGGNDDERQRQIPHSGMTTRKATTRTKQKQIPPLRCGMTTRRATATATATATADPPFDFAQGRLFGDDNKKGKGKSNRSRNRYSRSDMGVGMD